MNIVIKGLMSFCLLFLASCYFGGTEHIAVGAWESECHALRIYPDLSASFDGVAANWEKLDDSTIKVFGEIQSVNRVWEFEVFEAKSPSKSAGDDSEQTTTAQPDSAQDTIAEKSRSVEQKIIIYTGNGKPLTKFFKRVQEAKKRGHEYATMVVGKERSEFLRTQ